MPLTREFGNAALIDVAAHNPALAQRIVPPPATKKSAEAERIAEYNKAQASELTGHIIETNARPDSIGANGLHSARAQQRHYQHFAAMTTTAASLRAVTDTIGRLSFDTRDIKSPESVKTLMDNRDSAQQRHLAAAQNIPVQPQNVAFDPLTGMPVSRERYEWLSAKGTQCGGKFTTEDLVGGTYAHIDASGDYYNRHKLEESQQALDLQQTLDNLLEGIADGTLEYAALDPQEQLIVLQAQPLEKRMEKYAEQNLSESDIEKLENDVRDFQQTNRADFIGELARSKPLVTVNGGELTAGQISIDGLNHSFAGVAMNMAPIGAQFPSPVAIGTSTSFTIQPKQPELAPGM